MNEMLYFLGGLLIASNVIVLITILSYIKKMRQSIQTMNNLDSEVKYQLRTFDDRYSVYNEFQNIKKLFNEHRDS